ncbi:MAG TPA: SCP2 sterol-binding domain-containing protein [Rudaea sp.]|nr:SCP2 sterol-binding domain-containing protein [Rudaea sp.]
MNSVAAVEPRQPNPVLVRIGRALEMALNRALALDAETRERLAALQGRRIGIQLRGLDLALAISVSDGRLHVGPHWDAEHDLNLRAAPTSLLAMALRRGEDSFLPPGKVEISGDAELARRVEKLVRGFQPDIEEAFAQTFGDVIGVPMARALRRGLAWSRESAGALVRDTAEFLREESRDLIAPAEMEAFLDDVDTLRERADRLEARVQQLASRLRRDAS